MKKILRILGYFLLTVVILIAALLIYVKAMLPNVGEAENIAIDYTKERIQRGKYLVDHVVVCMDCHSTRDWSKFSGPAVPGTTGMGGERFDQNIGMPGVFYSKNITPAGIKDYTDGELFRVITTGVDRQGKAMFPLMPYPYYGKMDREDIYSIIAYIRTLPPIENKVPASVPDFPMSFIINTIPTKANPQPRPASTDQLAYGAYLVNAGGCIECHTQVDKGMIIPELAFGGGRDFKFLDGSVLRAANITPDEETGIGKWSENQFVARFKLYTDSAYVLPDVKPGEYNSVMPWPAYAGMTEEDLAAMYAYLKTIKPVSNKVDLFTSAAEVNENVSLKD